VGEFIDALEEGAMLLDAGCGNGKYLIREEKRDVVKFGCDLCEKLVHIAAKKGCEVMQVRVDQA